MRYSIIDNFRGIAIILVVFAHALECFFMRGLRLDGSFDVSAFDTWKLIYSFHMPAFYFVSGLTAFVKKETLKNTIVRSLTYIIIAYFIHFLFSPIAIISHIQNYSFITSLKYIVKPVFFGNNFSILIVWFLISLAIVQLIGWIFINSKYKGKIASLIIIISLLIYKNTVHSNIFQSNTISFGFLFYLFGYYISLHAPYIFQRATKMHIGKWAFIGIFSALSLILTYSLNKGCEFSPLSTCNLYFGPTFAVHMLHGFYGFIPLFIFTSLSGILTLLSVSHIVETTFSKHIFSYLGKHSLNLMLINGLVLSFLNPYLARHLPSLDWGWLYFSLLATLVQITLVPLSIPVLKWLSKTASRVSEGFITLIWNFKKPFVNAPDRANY